MRIEMRFLELEITEEIKDHARENMRIFIEKNYDPMDIVFGTLACCSLYDIDQNRYLTETEGSFYLAALDEEKRAEYLIQFGSQFNIRAELFSLDEEE